MYADKEAANKEIAGKDKDYMQQVFEPQFPVAHLAKNADEYLMWAGEGKDGEKNAANYAIRGVAWKIANDPNWKPEYYNQGIGLDLEELRKEMFAQADPLNIGDFDFLWIQ